MTGMADPIAADETKEMQRILEPFYGPQVRTWMITTKHYELLGTMIDESKTCTKGMHLVPRPYDLGNPLNWLRKQVRDAVRRTLLTEESKVYVVCMRAAALQLATPFREASLGL
jgi:hypothetical protein